jgi:predicted RecA/RadA family phage recombinase
MKNYICPGDNVTIIAAAPITSGDGILLNSIFGVAAKDANTDESVVLDLVGVFSLPKATGATWAIGDTIYWDNTAKNCTKTSASNTKVGVAYASAGSADTVGEVRLNGAF